MKKSIVSHLRGLIIVTMVIPTLSLMFLISEYPTNLFPIFFIGFLYVILVLLTSFYIKRKIIVPITVLGENAKNIMKGNMTEEIDYHSDDEIGQFALIFKQMKDQLLVNEQAKQRFEEERMQFIINITHDLKTPLSSIRAYVEGLQEGLATTEKEQTKYLEIIDRKAIEIEALMDQLKLIDLGEPLLWTGKPTKIPFRTWIEDNLVQELEKPLYQHSNFHTSIEVDPHSMISAHSQDLKRLVNNLLDNALRYQKDVLELKVFETPDKICLDLANDGYTLSTSEVKQVFDRFYTKENEHGNPKGHLGIGLHIADNIAKSMSATLSAEIKDELFHVMLSIPKIR
ncbi:HAMP domain-containing histidine kinase [Paenibacillus sp. 19GGS1-52]|uniref:HAMP domain-containing sensor histidine kinase n=1 Tax=Paenibacillus sp. 19GGS1-52 TaxID=2758563 RepID=UPI001EFA3A7B|nr:HAMP domain-containing sensor histidine kinase [Paenibacillus sp. 19GGS1-52]ULO09837.1 HAMP domain-containing histidine kinase [Paenibacillus sp. 19GGS1-52]